MTSKDTNRGKTDNLRMTNNKINKIPHPHFISFKKNSDLAAVDVKHVPALKSNIYSHFTVYRDYQNCSSVIKYTTLGEHLPTKSYVHFDTAVQ